MSSNEGRGCLTAIVGLVVICVIIIAGVGRCKSCTNNLGEERTLTTTVTDKTVKRYNGEDKYLVYTKNTDGLVEVFEITDSLAFGRFNSSDAYGGIEVGKTYSFTVVGERSEFYSIYPNIKEYNELPDSTPIVSESAVTASPVA